MNCNYRVQTTLPALFVLLLVVGLGCNREPRNIASVDYFVAGALVQVIDHDDAHATARIWRDNSFLIDGAARLAGTNLPYFESHVFDSAYQAILRPADSLAGDIVYFTAADGTRFADSVSLNVVDAFSISGAFDPPNRLLPGGGQVSLNWTIATNSEGYIIATVKAADAYTGVGYSVLAGTGVNAGTIPASVFVDPASDQLDTGLYYIYVYAYSGSPDSAQAGLSLPTALPLQLPLNIDKHRFTGRFGTLTVTAHDSVHVTSGS